MTTRYGTRNVNELEFKTPEEFATYKKKHKMRPGTVVKVAGKDKVVDAPKGTKGPEKSFPIAFHKRSCYLGAAGLVSPEGNSSTEMPQATIWDPCPTGAKLMPFLL